MMTDNNFGYLRLQKKWNFKCSVDASDFNRRHNKKAMSPSSTIFLWVGDKCYSLGDV